jgi:hypothetical protein
MGINVLVIYLQPVSILLYFDFYFPAPFDCINPSPAPPKSIGILGKQMEN